MKKLYMLAICTIRLGIGNTVVGSTGVVDTQIHGEVFEQASSQVQNIQVDFCGEAGKTKTYEVAAGESQDICLEIRNVSDQDIMMSLDFVDGTYTNDQRKNRACMDNNQKELFGQYVTGIQNNLVLPAKGYEVQHAKLSYPKGMRGDFLGCIVYYTKGISAGEDMDFSVLVRRAKFIDVTVKSGQHIWYIGAIVIFIVSIVGIVLWLKKFPHKLNTSHPKKRRKK